MPDKQNDSNNNADQKPQKSEEKILKHTIELALKQLERPWQGLALSGVSAGLDIGFSVLMMTVVYTTFSDVVPPPVANFLVANMYPIGFIFVILGRSELFTEHTAMAVLPVMQGLAGIFKLLRLWAIVFLSNIVGGLLFTLILSYFADTLPLIKQGSLDHLGQKMLGYSWVTLLWSGALAGWMMGLLTWLIAAARETIAQIAIIWFITASIGLVGLAHCIVGNIEVATQLFSGNASFYQYLHFLIPVTVGNTLGGVIFVGILKFSHAALGGNKKNVDKDNL